MDSILPSMSLESRRCEQSIHDSRRLSAQFPEVVALLEEYRALAVLKMWALKQKGAKLTLAKLTESVERIDKCLAALKGQKG